MFQLFHRYFQEVSVTFCYSCVDRSILTDYGKLTVGHQRLRLDKHASGKKSFETSYVSTVFWFNAFSKWIGCVSDSVKNLPWWWYRVDMSACIFSFLAINSLFGDEITVKQSDICRCFWHKCYFTAASTFKNIIRTIKKRWRGDSWTNPSEAVEDWSIAPMLSLR